MKIPMSQSRSSKYVCSIMKSNSKHIGIIPNLRHPNPSPNYIFILGNRKVGIPHNETSHFRNTNKQLYSVSHGNLTYPELLALVYPSLQSHRFYLWKIPAFFYFSFFFEIPYPESAKLIKLHN